VEKCFHGGMNDPEILKVIHHDYIAKNPQYGMRCVLVLVDIPKSQANVSSQSQVS
jgi:hypothetical protein